MPGKAPIDTPNRASATSGELAAIAAATIAAPTSTRSELLDQPRHVVESVDPLRLPQVILDVVEDRRGRDVLIAACLALLAAGLFPRTLSPSMPNVQTLLRAEPEILSVVVIGAFLGSANSIVGGVASDLWRRTSALVAGLVLLIASEAASIIFSSGYLYYAAQLTGVIASGVVISFSIGAVALNYSGTPRATALGVAFGVYGMGTATAPMMATLLGALGPYWPAYATALIAAVLALWAVRKWRPELPGELPISRKALASVGLWGVGLLAVITGLLTAGSQTDFVVRAVLVLFGGALIAFLGVRHFRRRDEFDGMTIRPRQMTAAVVVGGVVGFTQTIPLVLLPAVFEYVLQYNPPILATAAIAPFAVALFAAGPVAGIVLARYSPRAVLLAGTATLGIGAIALGLAFGSFGRDTNYLWLILPLGAIGAGFVISTTVRTALIFAATPRGLPATAAGYNEASVALGAKVGIVASTIYVATMATNSLNSLLAGRSDADARLAEFQNLVQNLSLPEFRNAVTAVAAPDRLLYATAYLDGVWTAIVASGVIAIIGAVLAWLLVGPGDPLHTVFDMQDERAAAQSAPAA